MAIIYVPDNWIRSSDTQKRGGFGFFVGTVFVFGKKQFGSRFPNNKEDLRNNADRSQ